MQSQPRAPHRPVVPERRFEISSAHIQHRSIFLQHWPSMHLSFSLRAADDESAGCHPCHAPSRSAPDGIFGVLIGIGVRTNNAEQVCGCVERREAWRVVELRQAGEEGVAESTSPARAQPEVVRGGSFEEFLQAPSSSRSVNEHLRTVAEVQPLLPFFGPGRTANRLYQTPLNFGSARERRRCGRRARGPRSDPRGAG